jgi:hypothetical protein
MSFPLAGKKSIMEREERLADRAHASRPKLLQDWLPRTHDTKICGPENILDRANRAVKSIIITGRAGQVNLP